MDGVEPYQVTARTTARMPAQGQWDDFAQWCKASYQCSQGYISPKRFTHKVHIFEFFRGGQKVGQCAITEPRIGKIRERVFLDSIQLEPHEFQWTAAMRAVLRILGPGRYRYGSLWSSEVARDDDLQAIEGVKLLSSEFYRVQAVDFSAWPNWDSYHRAMSTNAKRNAAKAKKNDPNMRIEVTAGVVPPMRSLLRMLWMRHNVYQRKSVPITFIRWSLRLVRRLVLLRRYSVVAWVVYHGRYTAFALGLRFGEQFYYTDGASVEDNGGSAWYLLTELLRKTKEFHPTGKFVMGFDPVIPWAELQGWDNVLRQRQQCKISESLTSVVVFDYRG